MIMVNQMVRTAFYGVVFHKWVESICVYVLTDLFSKESIMIVKVNVNKKPLNVVRSDSQASKVKVNDTKHNLIWKVLSMCIFI